VTSTTPVPMLYALASPRRASVGRNDHDLLSQPAVSSIRRKAASISGRSIPAVGALDKKVALT
jgi:hypothetical protein